MAGVTIDAGVLAAPPEDGPAADAHRYVESLLEWSKLLDTAWVSIFMSERASEALIDDGLFPIRQLLKRVFAKSGIVEYDVNTVAIVVDRLLQLTPSFETHFAVRDALADDLTIDPDILGLCVGDKLQSDLARCVVLIAILRHHCQQAVHDHSLILRRAPSSSVKVRALIEIVEHQRADFGAMPVPPAYFEGDVLVCEDFRGFVESLDDATILLHATNDVAVETAIRIATYRSRLIRERAPDWDDVPAHRIGHAFRASFERINPTRELASRVLRAMVETLEQTNMSATHWLRTGMGASNPQRVRLSDDAKAWRRDIDYERHLHYWNCDEGLVEFASVSFPHNDFGIPG